MDVYTFSFGVFTVANCLLGYLSSQTPHDETPDDNEPLIEKPTQSSQDAIDFQRSFFLVYTFVVAADWLQGPYMYALYKDEKNLSEPTVALLFATGFVTAAIAASFVGDLADRYGRKYACLWFCGMYAASCASMFFNVTPILFLGRALGGVSTTLMFSVFETWMVAEYHARDMRAKGLALSLVCGRMTTLSGVVAIVAGVLGQVFVDVSGTKVAPFLAAIVCLGVAAALISSLWPENYGTKAKLRDEGIDAGTDLRTLLKDKKIVSLSLISCLFEGTMYLFVFFWSAAIKSARAATGDPSAPPFGMVFATFLSAMMLGSLVFTLTVTGTGSGTGSNQPLTPSTSVQTLSLIIVLAAASLLAVVQFRSETLTLWAFCLFEACVGMYYPSMGYLKGQLVQDGVRGKVYGLMRLPLNVFVVVTLGVTREGSAHRDNVFIACSGLLIVAYAVCHRYLVSA